MIDIDARNRLAQQQHTQALVNGMTEAIKQVVTSNKPTTGPSLVIKHEEDKTLVSTVEKIGQALALVYTQIKKPIALPKILNITGKVEVMKQSPVEIKNFNDLGKYFQSLEQKLTVWAQAASTAKPPEINFPKFDFPKNDPIDISGITDAIQSLEKALQGHEKSSDTAILRRMADTLSEYTSRPSMTTPPVTNVTLNALQGVVKTTDNTVGQTLTPLPQYGQLPDRRALMIYNNSTNTIYWGGSDVTVANGIPITAGSFASPLDAGYNLKIYAIAASNGNDVRCVEISKDVTSSIQE
jgi:hypothetical protein